MIHNQRLMLCSSEISEEDVEAHISTTAVGSPPIDVWVRTSGVRRLSDYMTWQVRYHQSSAQELSLTMPTGK